MSLDGELIKLLCGHLATAKVSNGQDQIWLYNLEPTTCFRIFAVIVTFVWFSLYSNGAWDELSRSQTLTPRVGAIEGFRD